MKQSTPNDAKQIYTAAIAAVLPGPAVREALNRRAFGAGRVVALAAGKAAWEMARAARDTLGARIDCGVVITKYGHLRGPIDGFELFEAGHPVPDENGVRAAERALSLVRGLTERDTVLLLLSGGGSALFEKPLVPLDELRAVTDRLLASGADIVSVNTVRKRLSAVKGGRFALACAPARVLTVVLSDVLGDRLDAIASGPAYPDASTAEEARAIAARYELRLSPRAKELLNEETPKTLENVETVIVGSVRRLCRAAVTACEALGYETTLLTDALDSEARDAGAWLAALARARAGEGRRLALVAGGETVVTLRGGGRGGRNQELALSAALGIDGLDNVCIFSVGSDGTDGPTDAAGGIVTGKTAGVLRRKGLDPLALLDDNDAYRALKAADALIFTGPTGTNVNDLAVVLID